MIHPFLLAVLRNPRQIGAIASSSPQLARAMARQLDHSVETVLELGPGTGAITRALMHDKPHKRQIVLVEKDPQLARVLAVRFPGVRILAGDAAYLNRMVNATGIHQFDAVVSSLPLLSMSHFGRTRIIKRMFGALRPGGKLVQYTYGHRSPISSRITKSLGIRASRKALVVQNLPPATVWVYQMPE